MTAPLEERSPAWRDAVPGPHESIDPDYGENWLSAEECQLAFSNGRRSLDALCSLR